MFFPSSLISVHVVSSDMLHFSHLSFDAFSTYYYEFAICSSVICACNNIKV